MKILTAGATINEIGMKKHHMLLTKCFAYVISASEGNCPLKICYLGAMLVEMNK